MSNEAGEAAPPIVCRCRWAYHNPSNTNANPQTCSLAFPSRDALREHVLAQHVHAEPPVPVECLEVWQSAGGSWRGKVKVDALKSFRRSLKSNPGALCHAIPHEQVLRNREHLDDDPSPPPNTLAAHGIPQSQEISVVSQVFSPYITSSDEQPPLQQGAQDATPNNHNSSSSTNPAHAQQYTPVPNPLQTHSRSHIRNASDESASLPQSNDYETVPGIVPLLRELPLHAPHPHTSSPAHQAHQATAHTSPGDQPFPPQATTPPPPPPPPPPPISHRLAPAATAKATTPLHIGIAFGALPSVSSSGSGNAAQASGNANPFTSNPPAAAASNGHSESGMRTSTTAAAAAAGAGADSPTSGGRKHVDRPLRFGFGGK